MNNEIESDVVAWNRAFTERELQLINNCLTYALASPAGLPGHNLMLIIAKCAAIMSGNPVEVVVSRSHLASLNLPVPNGGGE